MVKVYGNKKLAQKVRNIDNPSYRKRKAKSVRFAKQVMSVVNKRAEQKTWTKESGWTNLSVATSNSQNLLVGLLQGGSTSNRIGDKIFIKNIRSKILISNTNASGSGPINNAVAMRMILYRGKYDYSTTGLYPLTEIFEGNAGNTPACSWTVAPIDTNQVTVLWDKPFVFPQSSVSGAVNRKIFDITTKINKTFYFRDDDNFGKNSNLYFAIVYEASATGDGTPAINQAHRVLFTDV